MSANARTLTPPFPALPFYEADTTYEMAAAASFMSRGGATDKSMSGTRLTRYGGDMESSQDAEQVQTSRFFAPLSSLSQPL